MRSCRSASDVARTVTPYVLGASTIGLAFYLFRRWVRKKKEQDKVVICKCHPRLFDKVVVITGATSGIGYQVALMSAQQRATVIFGARDLARGEQVAKKIRAKSDNPRVFSLYLDLNDLKSCKEFCKNILKKEPVIDILVNNAGVFNQKPELTQDGFERTWQTNYLGPVVVTENLLSHVGAGVSETGLIIFVSSEARMLVHPQDVMDVSQMQAAPEIRNMEESIRHYALTKLALWIYATYHAFSVSVARHYSVISVDPGSVWTNIYKDCWLDLPGLFTRLKCSLLMRSPQEGAQTIIHCMNYPKVSNGLMMKDCCEIAGPSRHVLEYSPAFVARTHGLVSTHLPSSAKVREDVSLCQDLSFDETDERNFIIKCT
ncbi:Short-chain dehydrogenase/reductase SDR [Trinorchestia longiramus]|nr:Short-chain dehydrogenase/reductase SDR [Trinorchestia longiramus]